MPALRTEIASRPEYTIACKGDLQRWVVAVEKAMRGRRAATQARFLLIIMLSLSVGTQGAQGQQPRASLSCGSASGQAGDVLVSFEGALDLGESDTELTLLVVPAGPPFGLGSARLRSVTSGIRAECRSQRALHFRLSGWWQSDTLRLVTPPAAFIQLRTAEDTVTVTDRDTAGETERHCWIRSSVRGVTVDCGGIHDS